jgi:N-acetyl sugar amidotransferase
MQEIVLKSQRPNDRLHRICSKTVMDTSDINIYFDKNGVSNHYYEYAQKVQALPQSSQERELKFTSLIEKIKADGKDKTYDCLIGLSGGVDSSYITYLAGENNLRPLIVHFDNGWNSETSVSNIKRLVSKYNFDLHTLVVDWEEFRDIQLSFFKASLPNIEIVTDHAIIATLFKVAKLYRIKYILSGSNVATEGILPSSWGYDATDFFHIEQVHKLFGNHKIRTYPKLTLYNYFGYIFVNRLKKVNILNYVEYSKELAIQTLEREVAWEYYGGKHFESVFTQFFQAYILPTKFGIDKRKAHLSSLICSGQITRNSALHELTMPLYSESKYIEHRDFLLKKWGLNMEEFNRIMALNPKSHEYYPNLGRIIRFLVMLRKSLSKIFNR